MSSKNLIGIWVCYVGLELVLFLEQYEYIPILTQSVGARVVVHDQSVMPFPGENAISVTANTQVNIGVKKVGILINFIYLIKVVGFQKHPFLY